jgi:hypothetical protein
MSVRLGGERLAGSWAKVDRAHRHVDDLRRAIVAASDGRGPPRVLATRREFDAEGGHVLFIAERMTEVGEDWGLLVGDAVHNLRCALDHLWWQLAIEHLGRRPTETEAREIQFPILTHLGPERFRRHRYLKHVSPAAGAKAEQFQRYDAGEDQVLLLSVLAELSNHDKHREIRPTFFLPTNTTLSLHPAAELMIDCKIPSEILDGREVFAAEVLWSDRRPRVGDVVAGMRVEPTGPNPDIDIEPEITGDIELGEEGYTFGILDELGNFVSGTLNWFAPLLGDETREEQGG